MHTFAYPSPNNERFNKPFFVTAIHRISKLLSFQNIHFIADLPRTSKERKKPRWCLTWLAVPHIQRPLMKFGLQSWLMSSKEISWRRFFANAALTKNSHRMCHWMLSWTPISSVKPVTRVGKQKLLDSCRIHVVWHGSYYGFGRHLISDNDSLSLGKSGQWKK